MAEGGAGAVPGPEGPEAPGAGGGSNPRPGPDWAGGLPALVLEKVARTLVAQTEAGWAAWLERRFGGCFTEGQIQEEMAKRKREGNCLFVFALVCKGWRKAQLKVGGPLRSRVLSDVIMPGGLELAKWALAEGCPREGGGYPPPRGVYGFTMAHSAADHGHGELVRWLCGEGGFAMDEQVMLSAAISGNFELTQWLRDEGCPLHPEMRF